ncbi:MAG: cytochrome c peroxidase [Pseudomonadota bacterium]
MSYLFCKAALLAGAAAAPLLASCASADDRLPAPLLDRDFHFNSAPGAALVSLGRDLFFDPILSGNKNISCGTCHDPARGTGDGLALGIGEGGTGFGSARRTNDGVTGRVPRNAQPLYNIGARSYRTMFHDGRLEPDPQNTFRSGFWSPAREDLPAGLATLLAAQAMFPVLSPVEMAGQKGENPVATAVAEDRKADAWSILAGRLAATPGYAARFLAAFGDVDTPQDIRFTHAATALAAFQTVAFRSDESPFDKALRARDISLMGEGAARGWALFSGKAGCTRCHSGPLLTDHAFHAIGLPQIGPGKGHGRDTSYWRKSGFKARLEDEGRYRVTFERRDMFRFRTPSLRNVALTGPWGHSGAFNTLEGVVRHHLDALASLESYTPAELPPLEDVIEQTGEGSRLIFRPLNPARRSAFDARDGFVQASPALRGRIAAANALAPVELSDEDVSDLLAFLHALTDPTAENRSDLIPASVPSGMPPQPNPPGQRIGSGETSPVVR